MLERDVAIDCSSPAPTQAPAKVARPIGGPIAGAPPASNSVCRVEQRDGSRFTLVLLVCGLFSLATCIGCSPAPSPTVTSPQPADAELDGPTTGDIADPAIHSPEDQQVRDTAAAWAPALEKVQQWGGRTQVDKAGRLIEIDLLQASLSDEQVQQLVAVPMPDLQVLRLRGLGITDEAMPAIAGLRGLTTLDLENVGVTDEGVQHLTALDQIQSLRLHRVTRLTDDVIEHFQHFPQLETLRLTDNDNISDFGLEALVQLDQLRMLDLDG